MSEGPMTEDRLKYLKISPPALIDLLKAFQGKCQVRVIDNALPIDAEVYSCGVDNFGYINLVIKSREFELIPIEGGELPALPSPIFEKIYPET